MANPKPRPNTQIRIPRSKSLWPSMPRNVTWDKSGSFKLASPPASSARADAALRSVSTAAVTPNLMNLQPLKQALASRTLIHFPPSLIRSPRKSFQQNRFRHTCSTERSWARTLGNLFTFLREDAAKRRYDTTAKLPYAAPFTLGAVAGTNRRFITFYSWPVKRSLLTKNFSRIVSDTLMTP